MAGTVIIDESRWPIKSIKPIMPEQKPVGAGKKTK